MPYLGRQGQFGIRQRFQYLASAGDTSVSGADANGVTMTFSDGLYIDVFLNGIKLRAGEDYNTDTANTVAGISAMNSNDEVEVIAYDAFTVTDTVSAADGGTFSGAVTMNGNNTVGGNLAVTGTTNLTGAATLGSTLTTSGLITASSGIKIANDGNIGSVGDADAMAISSGGVVTFSQAPIIPTPTFRASKVSGDQTFADATYTKITFDQEDWDIGGYYASSRYTPLVRGYYHVNVSLHLTAAVDTHGGLVALYHNGSMTRFNRLLLNGVTNDDFYTSTFKFNGMVFMDGVDDYIEVYHYNYSEDGGDCIIGADDRATYFEAFLVSGSG